MQITSNNLPAEQLKSQMESALRLVTFFTLRDSVEHNARNRVLLYTIK